MLVTWQDKRYLIIVICKHYSKSKIGKQFIYSGKIK